MASLEVQQQLLGYQVLEIQIHDVIVNIFCSTTFGAVLPTGMLWFREQYLSLHIFSTPSLMWTPMGQNLVVTGALGILTTALPVRNMQITQQSDDRKLYLGRERKVEMLFKSVQEPEFAFVY